MINKELLIKAFNNRKFADYLNGDSYVDIESGDKLKMPYLTYNAIREIEKKYLDEDNLYHVSARWELMLCAIENAIKKNKLGTFFKYLFSRGHIISSVDSKEKYTQLVGAVIEIFNSILSFYDIKIERFDEQIKLISTVNNEEISFETEVKPVEQAPIQCNELLNHRILSNLLLFSRSKEEALSWISIIESIEDYPAELIKEIKMRYTSNDFLTFKVVTDELEKLFDKIA